MKKCKSDRNHLRPGGYNMIRLSFVVKEHVKQKTAETSDDQTNEMCWCGKAEVPSTAHEMARGRYRAEWLIQEGGGGGGGISKLAQIDYLSSGSWPQHGPSSPEKRKNTLTSRRMTACPSSQEGPQLNDQSPYHRSPWETTVSRPN